jgi:hypothetical protein
MRVGGSFTSALTSFAGLGMALMLEEAGIARVRLGWTDTAEPRLMISGEGVDDLGIARIVHAHATRSATDDSWLEMSFEEKPWSSGTAVFSPRIKEAQSDEEWHYLQIRRSQGIDQVIEESRRWLDLDLLGALGEPAYWRFRRNHPDPDQGASRWEMKTRNHGGEFVGDRLRSLARIVTGRIFERVLEGINGNSTVDEAYRGKRSDESRTSTGLTRPRFTDSALAWCGLWGLAAFPVVHRVRFPSATAGHVQTGRRSEELVVPVLIGRYSVERWRAVIVSSQVLAAVGDDLTVRRNARQWLTRHGVRAVLHFPVQITDIKVPERYLGDGQNELLTI